jgi:nucleoside-diphosphate-sugar epimerase
MSRAPIDHFFHVAALTNFRDTPSLVAALVETNVHGTRRILRLAEALRVRQLAYVGSAYASGLVRGVVQPDDMNEGGVFRNPYERTKRDAEALVRSFAKESRIRVRYFRPSTICGRLSRAPLGSISEFKVFYAWGAYLLRLKAKMVSDVRALYDEPVSLDLRLLLHPEAGLNIVPVDYCAKVLYDACVQDDPGESYHLVNGADTPHAFYTGSIFALLNIRGIRVVDRMPTGLNRLERAYYRTVGEVFGPYVATPPVEFSNDSVRPVIDRTGTRCPTITPETFGHLMRYAKRHHFGVDVRGDEEWRPTNGRPEIRLTALSPA